MEAIVKLLSIAFMFFLTAILSTILGLIIGWVVGWFFGDTILSFFSCLGIDGFKMWQIGAALGFIGSFFRNSVSVNKKS
ncbi:MAG: hypothetical protein IJV97_05795 [Alphaproteobacteria bacterium]|nr:hypothetical protein [Alphaproteobacteria bacterium]